MSLIGGGGNSISYQGEVYGATQVIGGQKRNLRRNVYDGTGGDKAGGRKLACSLNGAVSAKASFSTNGLIQAWDVF